MGQREGSKFLRTVIVPPVMRLVFAAVGTSGGAYPLFECCFLTSVRRVIPSEKRVICVHPILKTRSLHKCCRHRVIHRDIKASNVLLGVDFEPQISDFGLAKWLPKQWTHHSVIPIEGTFGYLAPEYFMHGIVDEKTDVFAFGVLLLEIVTGRRPVDSSKQNQAKPLLDAGKITELADPNLRGEYDKHQLQRLVQIASNCIRQPSIWRPSMSEVLQLLSGNHDLNAADRWKMLEFEVDEIDDCSLDTDCYYPY